MTARLTLICGLPGSGKTTLATKLAAQRRAVRLSPELRTAARSLGVAVELYYLDASLEELWRRLDLRNQQAKAGTVPIQRADLEMWAAQFEAPAEAELALFNAPETHP